MKETQIEVITKDYRGPDRRNKLSPEDLDDIKEQLLESIYADIGKSVVKKALWVGGSILGSLYLMINHSEFLTKLLNGFK